MNDLISRQAAIDAFEKELSAKYNRRELAIGFVGIKSILEDLPSAQPEIQWIPCSERLPDEDHWTGNNFQYSADVLMTVYNAGDEETIIDYGHTTDGKWYSDTTDCYVPSEWEVTAWMPLPEPWKGEEHE